MQNSIIFERRHSAEGGYQITAPALPGFTLPGETFQKALEIIKNAAIRSTTQVHRNVSEKGYWLRGE